MSKVKLLTVMGYGTERNPYRGQECLVDVQALNMDNNRHVRGVIVSDFDTELDGSQRVGEDRLPIITLENVNSLVGKVLTVIDATFQDKEQRKAMKDILMQSIHGWYFAHVESVNDMFRRALRYQEEPSEDLVVNDAKTGEKITITK